MSHMRRWRNRKRELEKYLRDSDSNEDVPGEQASDCKNTPQTHSSSDHMHRSQSISNSDSAPEPPDMEDGSTDSETVHHDEGHGSVSFEEDLRKWAVRNKITHGSLNELLQILREQGHPLPIDARTLLGTPQSNTTEDKRGGRHAYDRLEKVRPIGQGAMASSSATSARVERMETIEEFRREEQRLADTEAFDALVLQLTRVGGKDTRDCVRKVLDRLLTNGLMARFNLKGKGKSNKEAFENTQCYRAVIDAVIRAQTQATEVAIKQCIGDHLKHAPSRRGGQGT